MDLDRLLKVAVRGGASDVILKVGAVPRFRFNGELVGLSEALPISQELMQQWVDHLLPLHLISRLNDTGDSDFAYQSPSGHRFRVNIFKQKQNFGIVLRAVSGHIRTLEELQMPMAVKQLADEKRGLVLITGATGSGKSTTLAAMIQKINLERSAHIITIEDPIEFLFKDERSTINQREIGLDTESFQSALRGALRQNPDVILVGELRDGDTTQTALMAAETGHLVLSTLHTSDSVESLTRLLSYFPPHQHNHIRQQLSQSLRGVVSQRLVPKRDGKGMVAAVEVLVANATVRETILKSEFFHSLHGVLRTGGDSYGMQSFDQSLLQLYQQGLILRETAIGQASRPSDMELTLRGVG